MDVSSSVVQITDLRKSYRSGLLKPKIEALRGVNLQVSRGKIFGLLGPNGAGKTTIIKILLGIVRATHGSASLLGRPAGDSLGRKHVGYLPENLQVPEHQTATTALEYFGRLSGMSHSQIKRRRDELLETVGLKGRERESVKRYSKGMRQRLGLAQALLHDPELLILDEPTDGLDPVGRSQVRDIMRQLSDEGRTVFVNSHLLQEVELICNHVAILDRGIVRYQGSLDDVPSSSQTDWDLELRGNEAEVRRHLESHTVKSCDQDLEGRLRVSITIRDQNEVNAVIDTLRLNQVDILALCRRKQSLETLFLDIVSRESPTL